jgi:hypothetical protein
MAHTNILEPSLSELEETMEQEFLSQPVLSELEQEIMRQEYFLSSSTHPQSITHVGNSTGDIRIVNSKPAIAYFYSGFTLVSPMTRLRTISPTSPSAARQDMRHYHIVGET